MGLPLLRLDQLSLEAIHGLSDLPAQGLLPFALRTALGQRSGQSLNVHVQTLDAAGHFALLLADASEIALPVFTHVAARLLAQLCFRQPLLQFVYPLLQLSDPGAHGLQRTFLAGFLGDPLRQLCLPGARFLFETLNVERPALRIPHQAIDPLTEISQEELQSSRIFMQRQGFHFFLAQGIGQTPALFSQGVALRLELFPPLAGLLNHPT